MARIDISRELLNDPDFLDRLQVTRTVQSVDSTGRAQAASTSTKWITGVVVPAGGRTMQIMPDLVNVNGAIDVYTKFRLEGPSDTTQADLVTWRQRVYVVSTVQPFTNWGSGFVHAVCTLQNLEAASTPQQVVSAGP